MQGHIGLNEVAIGISVPLYWGHLMARVIGGKQAEHLCKNAALLSPSEALKVGASFLCLLCSAFCMFHCSFFNLCRSTCILALCPEQISRLLWSLGKVQSQGYVLHCRWAW